MSKDESREIVYGMPYDEWRKKAPERGHARAEGWLREDRTATSGTPPREDRAQAKMFYLVNSVDDGGIVLT